MAQPPDAYDAALPRNWEGYEAFDATTEYTAYLRAVAQGARVAIPYLPDPLMGPGTQRDALAMLFAQRFAGTPLAPRLLDAALALWLGGSELDQATVAGLPLAQAPQAAARLLTALRHALDAAPTSAAWLRCEAWLARAHEAGGVALEEALVAASVRMADMAIARGACGVALVDVVVARLPARLPQLLAVVDERELTSAQLALWLLAAPDVHLAALSTLAARGAKVRELLLARVNAPNVEGPRTQTLRGWLRAHAAFAADVA